jgi:hypothetical protein
VISEVEEVKIFPPCALLTLTSVVVVVAEASSLVLAITISSPLGFNTILNFISNNLEEFDDEFDQFNPNDWIDKINNNFQLHKPKNPSPRNKKFIGIKSIE